MQNEKKWIVRKKWPAYLRIISEEKIALVVDVVGKPIDEIRGALVFIFRQSLACRLQHIVATQIPAVAGWVEINVLTRQLHRGRWAVIPCHTLSVGGRCCWAPLQTQGSTRSREIVLNQPHYFVFGTWKSIRFIIQIGPAGAADREGDEVLIRSSVRILCIRRRASHFEGHSFATILVHDVLMSLDQYCEDDTWT